MAKNKSGMNVILYVEDSVGKHKIFKTEKAMNSFVSKFHTSLDDGYWIEYTIANIHGAFVDMEAFRQSEEEEENEKTTNCANCRCK